MSAEDEALWPIESQILFTNGTLVCPCNRIITLWWNGGELDVHQCPCGRHYRTVHGPATLVVRRNPHITDPDPGRPR